MEINTSSSSRRDSESSWSHDIVLAIPRLEKCKPLI
uniref:Uncharacterized protein n=1 Tax=Anguilla anguilla TaxID=7936 RepID=A0A0E9QX51_ANGAN